MPDAPPTQAEKAERFHALHRGAEPFILANAFDAGSARILAGLGFEALGTTSGGFAGTLGRCDGEVTREEALDHARAVVDAVDLPVSADLENGFGHEPEETAKTVALAAEAGLVGCTIEDFTGDMANPFYARDLAVERIAAAAEAARSVGFRFMLTARSECFIRGLPDLDEVIARLQAYESRRGRCPDGAGIAGHRCGRGRMPCRVEAGQFHGGRGGPILPRGRSRGGGRQAHQPCDVVVPGRDERRRRGSRRGDGEGHLLLCR